MKYSDWGKDDDIEKHNKFNNKWHNQGITPTKDKRMAMTEENFNRVISMRDELILEQKEEISKLKAKVNKLQQRIDQYYQV